MDVAKLLYISLSVLTTLWLGVQTAATTKGTVWVLDKYWKGLWK